MVQLRSGAQLCASAVPQAHHAEVLILVARQAGSVAGDALVGLIVADEMLHM